MRIRQAEYKPLLFTTTLRNPERLKDFLRILFQYDGKILTDKIIDVVARTLIQKGLYQPTKVVSSIKSKWQNDLELTKSEAAEVFSKNPQSHKEAGFSKGWPSRFDTWFKFAKELGFVWYLPNEKIEFSESGKLLLDQSHPENEVLVFANAFAKYQRNNPFRRILNKNIPLVLLIQTIQLLNDDPQFNNCGISRLEIPLLLCWQNSDAESLYREIKKIRAQHGYSPSNEIILASCSKLINATKRDAASILTDYPDDFIRKMRLTSLFSLRGAGRFVDINKRELAVINYILKNYKAGKEFSRERLFFEYIGRVDKQLTSLLTIFDAPSRASHVGLYKWVEYYSWETIKKELLNLANRQASSDPVLKIIEQPLRLEFLMTLAILKKLPAVVVRPNFMSDDEGLPTSVAPGGCSDIECREDTDIVLIEVTLLTGTQQHIRESFSVHRHLEEYIQNNLKAYSLFIAPKLFIDTERYFTFIKVKDNLDVRMLDIARLVINLDNKPTLNEVSVA
ncbi:MAG: AlwI family type II restriction endonuclease [Candidatus Margulisbacteria bacterium]|jgi:hypothetical protein|nr:AlwI family type II restriction endonuclease [Candidatus Margulisiibacteriota bacterium]